MRTTTSSSSTNSWASSPGDQSGDDTLVDTIKAYLQSLQQTGNVYLRVVHRLDRPTSGAIVYAKTEKALSRLELFRTDAVEDLLGSGRQVPPHERGRWSTTSSRMRRTTRAGQSPRPAAGPSSPASAMS